MPNHVFISYAHIDNEPLPPSDRGWVSIFDEALKKLLSQKMGRAAEVWRDPRMERSAVFNAEIFNNVKASLTFVSVVSPRYITSDFCLEELEHFLEENAPIGTNPRVFKAIKTPVEIEEMPKLFQETNAFNYFTVDADTKIPREYGLDYGKEYAEKFLLTTSDLAYEIAKVLKRLEKSEVTHTTDAVIPAEAEAEPEKTKATVYLAETSAEFQNERANIRRDLLDRGYRVLPSLDAEIPTTTQEFEAFVRSNLAQSSLSVHLIGKNYGERPEDGDLSYIHLQTLVAAERAAVPNFTRIVWLPKEVNSAQSEMENFVNDIWASTASGVEVLQKPLEELKTNILDALNRRVKTVAPSKPTSAKPTMLVLYDKSDLKAGTAIEEDVKAGGFRVWSTAKYLDDDNPAKLFEAQNWYLRNCDAVLVYWGNAQEFWTQIMLQKLQKIMGDGREDPFIGQALYIDGDHDATDLADEAEVELTANPAELAQFLATVKTEFHAKSEKRGQK